VHDLRPGLVEDLSAWRHPLACGPVRLLHEHDRPADRYRRGGFGEVIRFATARCTLGFVLVGMSKQGICAIELGDDPNRLEREFRKHFPKAGLVTGDAQLRKALRRVVAFVDAPKSRFELPLDIRGTVFQQRVWNALREISPGSTESYAQLAARIQSPKAVRAVASACAANKIAVAIPCHRVRRSDGSLAGYRWGVRRKRLLLQRERQTVEALKKRDALK
jgi:AraC family transcriptional regulator of adaptative response/methylated-DNA-[protein]-cysteine methyltransferase